MRYLHPLALLSFALTLGFPAFMPSAFADSCGNLDANKEWVTTLKLMEQAMQYEDYDKAMEYAKKLQGICDRSPVLNYIISQIYHKRGDKEKELIYLQLAARNTNEFKIDVDFLDKIWTDKFIALHPDSDPQKVEALKQELESLKHSQANAVNSVPSCDIQAQPVVTVPSCDNQPQSVFPASSGDIQLYKGLLWTSVGVSVAGLALTSVGAAYVASKKSKSVVLKDNNQVAANGAYAAGWALLGSGIATTILGITGTGIFGYKYSHANNAELSVILSPDYAGIHMTF